MKQRLLICLSFLMMTVNAEVFARDFFLSRESLNFPSVSLANYFNGSYTIDESLLAEDLEQIPELTFHLNQQITIEAYQSYVEVNEILHTQTWIGKVYGDQEGLVVITKNTQGLSGEIRAFNRSYKIQLIPFHKQVIESASLYSVRTKPLPESRNDMAVLDQVIFQQAMKPVTVPDPTSVQQLANPATTIDIMVIYTANALAAAPSIVTDIANDIAYANAVFDRSCTRTKLRVVHTEQVAYDDSSVTADQALDCISNTSDGCIDGIEATRNTHGADLIQLWSALPITDACGIGLLYHPTQGIATSYSVKVIDCTADTTTHEIGHNMGLVHDTFESGVRDHQSNLYTPGYGYVDLELGHRTIMSYSSQCQSYGVSCPRIPYFSNPRIVYKGKPLGEAQRTDSSYQLIKNKLAIAAYKPEATTAETPTFSLCSESPESKKKVVEGCFIASWLYDDYDSPNVWYLRTLRDKYLEKNYLGRKLVAFYYYASPRLITLASIFPVNKELARTSLDGLVWFLKNIKDLLLGFIVFFLGGGVVFVLRRYHLHKQVRS